MPARDDAKSAEATTSHPHRLQLPSFLRRYATSSVESRGIERVPDSQRQPSSLLSTLQMGIVWFSTNLAANNLAVGMLGPASFALSLKDSCLIMLFANLLGCLGPAYISGFGPKSGNRTLVVARYAMGYWPGKLCVVLQLILTLGYGLIAVLVCGQILSAVADGKMSVIVGVVVAAIVSAVVTTAGMRAFHVYERYAWVLQLVALFAMIGAAYRNFDTGAPSVGAPVLLRGNRISFFFIIFNTALPWATCSADYFVYYPSSTPRRATAAMTHIGCFLGMLFVELLGACLASGSRSVPAWEKALSTSSGALMVESYAPLGGFGKFCAVLLALGPISNNCAGTYSAALAWQCFGRPWQVVPRWAWNIGGVVVYTAAAIAGRNQLFTIFENFLAIVGYWTCIWVTIFLLEHLLFRSSRAPKFITSSLPSKEALGWDWTVWDRPAMLPLGLAAFVSFLVGWSAAVLCMYQVWWVGPIAERVQADVGVPVAIAWTALAFPGLRWLELRRFGR